MKAREVAFKVGVTVTTAVITFTTLLGESASAATQFPSGDHRGVSVDWSGVWKSPYRLEDITLQICDATPQDKNQASAMLQAYVWNNGHYRTATAPSIFRVPIGDKKCYEWRDAFLTYSRDGDRLDYARVFFGGSGESAADWWWVKWVRNPFQGP